MLAHAREHVPLYSGRIPLGDDPHRVLAALAPLDRETVRAAGHRLHALDGSTQGWRSTHTSGTTGEPLTVVFDHPPQELEFTLLTRHADRLGLPEGAGIVHLTLHAPGHSQAMAAPWGDGRTLTKWNLARVWQCPGPEFRRAVRWLDGKVLTGKPTVLDLLAARADAVPAGVIVSGETLDARARATIGAGLHCPVSSLYTLAEVGIAGSECPDGGYHLEPESVHGEIVDDEVILTPLANRAMPLLRYRTGDRARWLPADCGCRHPGPRLELTSIRSPRYLLTTSGQPVELSRFLETLGALPVSRLALSAEGPGRVRMDYSADAPLTSADRERATRPLRAALGLTAEVRFVQQRGPHWPASDGQPTNPQRPEVGLDLPADDVAAWLAAWFTGRELRPEAVALTGSVLTPSARTRFSPVDVTVISPAARDEWADVVRALRRELPALRVHVVDAPSGLAACRLSAEGRVVLGRLPEIAWPTRAALAAEGRAWCRQAADTLWDRLTGPPIPPAETLRTAYVAQHLSVTACRYLHLASGGRETGADAVLAAELDPEEGATVFEAVAVAREQRPPPPEPDAGRAYLRDGMRLVGMVAAVLSDFEAMPGTVSQ